MTSRFNNNTIEINRQYKECHPNLGCIYGSPNKIATHIPLNNRMIILEMNNDINRIVGIGMVLNKPYCKNYKIYDNGNYNRFVYSGKYRIDREQMSKDEDEIMRVFEVFCFTGNKHMKRGQGLLSFPIDILFKCSRILDLTDFIVNMFKKLINVLCDKQCK